METYVAWNLHQPTPDTYDFDGMLDVVSFVQQAQQAGLLVIIRPGPYICAGTNFNLNC